MQIKEMPYKLMTREYSKWLQAIYSNKHMLLYSQ